MTDLTGKPKSLTLNGLKQTGNSGLSLGPVTQLFKSMRFIQLLVILAFISFYSINAQAFLINIDPGAYTGFYSIRGQTSAISGILENIELSAGNFAVQLTSDQNIFLFNVDAAGDVTSLNTAAAQGAGNTLTFNTTTIIIDPAA